MVAKEAEAEFAEAGFHAVYRTAGRVSIDNTGQRKKVLIRETSHMPKLSVRAAPALDPAAYLYASFANAGEASTLPGRVALYRDGIFAGNGRLPLLAPGEDHELGFGTDDAVKIKRVEINRKQGETGIITTSHRQQREFKISIENHHAQDMPVTILDRVPVADNEAIDIDITPASTPFSREDVEDKRGIVAWDIDMKPGQKSEISFGYRVTWPKDKLINLAQK